MSAVAHEAEVVRAYATLQGAVDRAVRTREFVANALHAGANEQRGFVVGEDLPVDVQGEAILFEPAPDQRIAFSGCIRPCPFAAKSVGATNPGRFSARVGSPGLRAVEVRM